MSDYTEDERPKGRRKVELKPDDAHPFAQSNIVEMDADAADGWDERIWR